MLFNSFEFILFFLPATIMVFYLLHNKSIEKSLVFLALASLGFYSYWKPVYLVIILGSIFANFLIGRKLSHDHSKPILTIGVILNLFLLGYYKYTDFIIGNVNSLFSTNIPLQNIFLPLAISFFTFQQIAFLVDSYRGETKDYSFSHYLLFVSFFPQLIAGPIVHHKEIIPQFFALKDKVDFDKISNGIAIFALGILKKTMIADELSKVANGLFNNVGSVDL
jgi:alginate O-acetyltransferase complex protein AlgI